MIIRIHNLRAVTTLGVYEWEKQALRSVILNLEMHLADNRAGESDDLTQTVDYAAVSQLLRDELLGMKVELIETLVHRLLVTLGEHFPMLTHASLRIDKPGILPEADSVSVEDSRSYRNFASNPAS